MDPATPPPDAVRHGTTATLVQDLVLQPEVIRFVREVWLVPSTGQTITAPLPDGYDGAFARTSRPWRSRSVTGPTSVSRRS